MARVKNLDDEKEIGLKSLEDSVRFRFNKTEEVLNIDLANMAAELQDENDSIRLSELLTGRQNNVTNSRFNNNYQNQDFTINHSRQKSGPKINIKKNKVEKGKFNELRFDDKVIGFAMPGGQYSSDSMDYDPSNLYSGAENCVQVIDKRNS